MKRENERDSDNPVWSPPTRRAFVAMLGAAAAAVALRVERRKPAPAPRDKPLWIGHC